MDEGPSGTSPEQSHLTQAEAALTSIGDAAGAALGHLGERVTSIGGSVARSVEAAAPSATVEAVKAETRRMTASVTESAATVAIEIRVELAKVHALARRADDGVPDGPPAAPATSSAALAPAAPPPNWGNATNTLSWASSGAAQQMRIRHDEIVAEVRYLKNAIAAVLGPSPVVDDISWNLAEKIEEVFDVAENSWRQATGTLSQSYVASMETQFGEDARALRRAMPVMGPGMPLEPRPKGWLARRYHRKIRKGRGTLAFPTNPARTHRILNNPQPDDRPLPPHLADQNAGVAVHMLESALADVQLRCVEKFAAVAGDVRDAMRDVPNVDVGVIQNELDLASRLGGMNLGRELSAITARVSKIRLGFTTSAQPAKG